MKKPHGSLKESRKARKPNSKLARKKTSTKRASIQAAVQAVIASVLSPTGEGQKSLLIAEMLREEGLDEKAIAKTHVILMGKLLQGDKPNGGQKLLADELKELTRLLEPVGAAGSGFEMDPMDVQVIHDIPRPPRAHAAGNDDPASEELRFSF